MPIEQQFIEYIVKQIVDDPDGVSIEHTVDDKGVLLRLTVKGDDIGRVIGKRGSTAQALRTMLRALGTKNDARYNLKIVDPDQPEEPPRNQESTSAHVVEDQPAPMPEVTDEPVVEEPVEVAEEVEDQPQPDSKVAKARKELAELDDLDI